MDAKTINRIIRAVLAALLLAFAGQQGLTAGWSTGPVIAGALGAYFLFGAVTGKG